MATRILDEENKIKLLSTIRGSWTALSKEKQDYFIDKATLILTK